MTRLVCGSQVARLTVASSGSEGDAGAPPRDTRAILHAAPGPGTNHPFSLLLASCYTSGAVPPAAAAAVPAEDSAGAPVPLTGAAEVTLVTLVVPQNAAAPALLASVFPPPLGVTLAPDAAAEGRARAASVDRSGLRGEAACIYSCVSVGGSALTATELARSPLLKDFIAPARKLQILQVLRAEQPRFTQCSQSRSRSSFHSHNSRMIQGPFPFFFTPGRAISLLYSVSSTP